MGKEITANILHRTASAWGRRREEEILQTCLIKRGRQPFLWAMTQSRATIVCASPW